MKTLIVRVRPNATKTKVTSEGPEEMALDVAAPPEDNKANIEVIKFLSKHFKSKIEIIRGLKSKTKLIRIT
jgi:uncharacterized protein (TIGR00251 family)